MQTWHCVALILLSIGVYFYASYIKEVDQHSQKSVNLITEQTPTESTGIEILTQDKNTTTVWAEVVLWMQTSSEKEVAIRFHEEILESKGLLQNLLEELNKSPMASSIIFAPFISDMLETNQLDILSSLISLHPVSGNSIKIICKGHSEQSAKILSDAVQNIYNRLILNDSPNKPLLPRLQQKLSKLEELEGQIDQLKILVQEEMQNSPSESIEVMAMRSEIMQLDQDIKDKKGYLIRIEEIYSDQKNPAELLDIPPIRDFDKVTHIDTILKQLKNMLSDQTLNEFTREEVQKNIKANSLNLEKQVISAIEFLKEEVSGLLSEKKALQKAIFDQISETEMAIKRSPNVLRLDDLRQLQAVLKKEYEDENLLWIACKSSYSLFVAP